MCLFHKWEIIKQGTIPVSISSIFSNRATEDVRIISIEQCKKCGTKRAFLYPPFYPEDKKEIDVFYAETSLGGKCK